MLNPDAPIPLYRQLADELEKRIHSGELVAGARIPSEHELAALHGIGRPTVRQATDHLVRRGLVERRKGSGTFVLAPPKQVDLFNLGGTIAAFEGAGLALRTSLVEPVRRFDILGEAAGPLAGRPGFSFARLGCVEEAPVVLEVMYLDGEVFPGFELTTPQNQPLSVLVERRYGYRPTGGHQTIRVCQLRAREARLLKVESRHGALLVERTLDFGPARTAFFARIFALTEGVVWSQTLTDHSH